MQVLAASFTQHYTPVANNVLLSALVAALLITGILSGLALRLRPGEIGRVFLGTCAGSGARC